MRSTHATPYNTTPGFPLSPTTHSPTHHRTNPPSSSRRRNRPELRLPSLPGQFHPLVYESQNNSKANSPITSRPSSSHDPLSPQLRARKGIVAQRQAQQIQQSQRDVLARAATALMGPAPATDTPKAPYLVPHGSPGPATPFALEESKDYMTAGAMGEGSPQNAAEKYVREEQERHSGMRADPSSPAVGPRC